MRVGVSSGWSPSRSKVLNLKVVFQLTLSSPRACLAGGACWPFVSVVVRFWPLPPPRCVNAPRPRPRLDMCSVLLVFVSVEVHQCGEKVSRIFANWRGGRCEDFLENCKKFR